jgi:Arc/MetJ family transcription regulator
MKTHIDIDAAALEEVFQLGGFPTKRAAVDAALRELARQLKRRKVLELRGTVPWEGNLNELRNDRTKRRE